MYNDFDKARISSFSKIIADHAENRGDTFCIKLLEENGKNLADLLSGILRENTTDKPINVICCGSVFKSFHLLEGGFVDRLVYLCSKIGVKNNMRFYRLQNSCAFGACAIAAEVAGNHRLRYSFEVKIAEISAK